MDSMRTKILSWRYGSNLAVACAGTVLVIVLYSTQLVGPKYFGTSEKAVECYVPDDKVIVDLDQVMRSPISLAQDDPKLLKKIKDQYMYPPSGLPYDLKGGDDPSMGQSEKVRELLGDKSDGFFIECGALDGETRSNTLYFEKVKKWRGILIEGDPKNFELVLKKQRKSYAVKACLSTAPYPNTVMFKQSFNLGKISAKDPSMPDLPGHAAVQCLPLYSILLAANVTTVDYFSLDVEGHELEVLKTIPWDKVDIKTLSVEYIHGKDGKAALRKYMEAQGYVVYAEVTNPLGLANDFIFRKYDLIPAIRDKQPT